MSIEKQIRKQKVFPTADSILISDGLCGRVECHIGSVVQCAHSSSSYRHKFTSDFAWIKAEVWNTAEGSRGQGGRLGRVDFAKPPH